MAEDPVDYSTWDTESLIDEIAREKSSLDVYRDVLEETETRISQTEKNIFDERRPERVERYASRARLIAELERSVAEFNLQIARVEAGVADSEETIRILSERIERLERSLPRLSVVERFIPRRVIARLVRSRGGYRAALTRRTRQLDSWRNLRSWTSRRIGQLRRQQEKEGDYIQRIRELLEALDTLTEELKSLQETIRLEEARLKRKKDELDKRRILSRIKVRIYNEERKPTPSGMFQTFWEIDAVIDAETELPDWEWWLTKREIEISKYHTVGYFKGLAKWTIPEQMTLAYFDSPEGIPYKDSKVKYKRKKTGDIYTKNVPIEFIEKAEALTVSELIVGESSVEPEPNTSPSSQNMGVWFERAMILNADGVIKWDEVRRKWIWHPSEEQVERVKRELKDGKT